ncbi:MAG: hypothetical protein IJG94_05180 [Clostridia bacterium]|nr:hypothetical protein [Clostridia bacterium]
MAENKNSLPVESEIAKQLRKIAGDLWGKTDTAPVAAEPKPKKEKPKKVVVDQPVIGIGNLWKTADETIDWTDALSHSRPSDGLADARLWRFFHEKAAAVLAGDLKAYAEVLKISNPLGELTEFADDIRIQPVGAERLESRFTAKAEYLEKKPRAYCAAVSIRIARDLFACLPVEEVAVQALSDGKEIMNVTYRRDQLLHRNFSFLDPEAFAEECGAEYSI